MLLPVYPMSNYEFLPVLFYRDERHNTMCELQFFVVGARESLPWCLRFCAPGALQVRLNDCLETSCKGGGGLCEKCLVCACGMECVCDFM